MRKIEREYIKLSQQCGLDLIRIEHRSGHIALHFGCGVVFAAGTPSDCRNRANVLGQMRRLANR